MFAKVNTTGPDASPLWLYLGEETNMQKTSVKTYFTKFLCGKEGEVIGKYS